MKWISEGLHQLMDVVAPRCCTVCGGRLGVHEQVMCSRCNLHLPRTGYEQQPYDNPMARLFWGLLPLERCAALFFYIGHAPASNLIYRLKYHRHPEIGRYLGRLVARDFAAAGFFEGVDALVAVPLHARRERERGYNQSREIARGVAAETGLPLIEGALQRTVFGGSQTRLNGEQRLRNVTGAFRLINAVALHDKHVLLIDDVVTTGATLMACAEAIKQAGDVRISMLTIGCTTL